MDANVQPQNALDLDSLAQSCSFLSHSLAGCSFASLEMPQPCLCDVSKGFDEMWQAGLLLDSPLSSPLEHLVTLPPPSSGPSRMRADPAFGAAPLQGGKYSSVFTRAITVPVALLLGERLGRLPPAKTVNREALLIGLQISALNTSDQTGLCGLNGWKGERG